MLRNCKADVVVIVSSFCYNEITKSKDDFIMKLSDKIIKHTFDVKGIGKDKLPVLLNKDEFF